MLYIFDADGWMDESGKIHDEDIEAAHYANVKFVSANSFFNR